MNSTKNTLQISRETNFENMESYLEHSSRLFLRSRKKHNNVQVSIRHFFRKKTPKQPRTQNFEKDGNGKKCKLLFCALVACSSASTPFLFWWRLLPSSSLVFKPSFQSLRHSPGLGNSGQTYTLLRRFRKKSLKLDLKDERSPKRGGKDREREREG